MSQAAIRTRALTKDYLVGFWRPRPYRALDALSIDVAPGDVFGFLGPNGAGKTTTIKMLIGLLRPSAGIARIGGYDIQRDPIAAKSLIASVPTSNWFDRRSIN